MDLTNVAEMRIAQRIQRSFANKSTKPFIHNLEYAGRSVSSRRLTGDYYDFIEIGADRIVFAVADVSGKGVPAALLMAHLRASIISQDREAFDDLPGVLRRVHQLFYESSPSDHFASLFLGDYDERASRLTYVNCGQVPPLLVSADEKARKLAPTAPVIGMIKDWNCAVNKVKLMPADILVMCTDGVTEARSSAGEYFGYDRLIRLVRNGSFLKPASMAVAIIQAAESFAGFSHQDDLTAVIVRVR